MLTVNPQEDTKVSAPLLGFQGIVFLPFVVDLLVCFVDMRVVSWGRFARSNRVNATILREKTSHLMQRQQAALLAGLVKLTGRR